MFPPWILGLMEPIIQWEEICQEKFMSFADYFFSLTWCLLVVVEIPWGLGRKTGEAARYLNGNK